jgi:hypothetical protein
MEDITTTAGYLTPHQYVAHFPASLGFPSEHFDTWTECVANLYHPDMDETFAAWNRIFEHSGVSSEWFYFRCLFGFGGDPKSAHIAVAAVSNEVEFSKIIYDRYRSASILMQTITSRWSRKLTPHRLAVFYLFWICSVERYSFWKLVESKSNIREAFDAIIASADSLDDFDSSGLHYKSPYTPTKAYDVTREIG